jgi:hypothetical protein
MTYLSAVLKVEYSIQYTGVVKSTNTAKKNREPSRTPVSRVGFHWASPLKSDPWIFCKSCSWNPLQVFFATIRCSTWWFRPTLITSMNWDPTRKDEKTRENYQPVTMWTAEFTKPPNLRWVKSSEFHPFTTLKQRHSSYGYQRAIAMTYCL